MKQKLLLLLMALLPSAMTWAAEGDEFTVDGLVYRDCGDGLANVKGYATAPTGALVIPGVVMNPDTKELFNVVIIGPEAFKGCTGLTTVTIPYTICQIGEDAFNGCTNVTDVYCWSYPNASWMNYWPDAGQDDFKPGKATRCHVRAYNLDDFAGMNNSNFSPNVTFVGEEDKFKVGNLWYRVTNEEAKMVEVTHTESVPTGVLDIPETVTRDGKIYSVTGIGEMAFAGCEKITRVIIPSRVSTIGKDAFWGCTGVTDVWFYAPVPEWDENGCDDFKDDKATICYVRPEMLSSFNDGINKKEYDDDHNLIVVITYVNVTFQSIPYETMTLDDITYVQTSTNEVMVYRSENETTGNLVIPAKVKNYTVTSIGDYAFQGCKATTVTIPETVTSIGYRAFENSSLTSLTIPDGVTSVEAFAFNRSQNLETITIGSGLRSVEANAFSMCTSVTDVYCYVTDPSVLDWEESLDFNIPNRTVKFHVAGDVTAWRERFAAAINAQFGPGDDVATLTDADSYYGWSDRLVASATYTKTIGSECVGKHQAWMLPFDYTITSDDEAKFTFYKINMIANAPNPSTETTDEMWVFLTRLSASDVLQANRPYLYKPKTAVTDYEFTTEAAILKARIPVGDYILKTETTEDVYSFYAVYSDATASADNPFYYVNTNGGISLGNEPSVTVGPYCWIIRKTSKLGDTPTYALEMHIVDGVNGDVNGDGKVDVADIAAIISIMAGK